MNALKNDTTFQKYLKAHDLVVVVSGDGRSSGSVACIVRPVNLSPVKTQSHANRVEHSSTQMFFDGRPSVASARKDLRRWLKADEILALNCGYYHMPFNPSRRPSRTA
jgi:hypothetical protein